tara:strand:- start:4 stop:123 length:120 start_codon:yes stop_codon:yes gene_type:complete
VPKIKIGERAVDGCSIVTEDVPSKTVYADNPARLIKNLL